MKTEQERKTARAIMEALLEVDVDAYQRTVTDAEDTICRVLQQVKNCDLADVGGTLLSDVVTKTDDGNYMILLIDGNKNYATYADNLPELFDRLADAFRAMEDTEL